MGSHGKKPANAANAGNDEQGAGYGQQPGQPAHVVHGQGKPVKGGNAPGNGGKPAHA